MENIKEIKEVENIKEIKEVEYCNHYLPPLFDIFYESILPQLNNSDLFAFSISCKAADEVVNNYIHFCVSETEEITEKEDTKWFPGTFVSKTTSISRKTKQLHGYSVKKRSYNNSDCMSFHFFRGELHGPFYINESIGWRREIYRGHFFGGKLHKSLYISYIDKSGHENLECVRRYNFGKLNPPSEKFDMPGRKTTVENFGKTRRKKYYENNRLCGIVNYIAEGNILHGQAEKYFPNGSKKVTKNFIFGKLSGLCVQKNNKGDIIYYTTMADGCAKNVEMPLPNYISDKPTNIGDGVSIKWIIF